MHRSVDAGRDIWVHIMVGIGLICALFMLMALAVVAWEEWRANADRDANQDQDANRDREG